MSADASVNRSDRWRIPRLLALITALIVLGSILWYAANVFLLIFAGLLVAILLDYLCNLVSRATSLSHGWSLAVVLLALLALAGVVVGVFAARIAGEADNFTSTLQTSWEQLKESAGTYQWSQQLLAQSPIEQLGKTSGEWLSKVTGVFSSTLGVLSSLLVLLFVAIFTAAEPQLYVRGLLHLVPIPSRPRALEVLNEIGFALRWWFIGQLFSMTVVGLATAAGLWFLDIPFFITLGVLAGVLTFIPNFGPIISAIPAILLGLTNGPLVALYVILLYVAIQAVESNLLTPLIQQRNVHLPPVLNVGMQILMGVLFGVLGLIVAAPFTVCLMIAVKRLYVEDILGDTVEPTS